MARLVESVTHQIQKTAKNCGFKLSEVDKRDHDCYWDNIENTITLPEKNSKSENLFPTDTPRVVVQSI